MPRGILQVGDCVRNLLFQADEIAIFCALSVGVLKYQSLTERVQIIKFKGSMNLSKKACTKIVV